MPATVGTNQALILSANFCTGGKSFCACLINLIMFANAVSLPTAVAEKIIDPFSINVPALTVSFLFF